MPKVVLHGKYSKEAWAGVAAGGATERQATVGAMFEGLGAKLEAIYMMPGSNWDFMMIVDGANAETMAAIKKAVGPTGSVTESSATVIMTPEEFDAVGGGSSTPPS